MADSTIALEFAMAVFVGIMLTVQYGHPLSANISAADGQKIANTEDPYPVAVPNALKHSWMAAVADCSTRHISLPAISVAGVTTAITPYIQAYTYVCRR